MDIRPTHPQRAPLRAARHVFLVFAAAAAASVWAADGDAEGEGTEVANDVEEVAVERSNEAEAPRERPPRPPVARDVFVPSEEISEDVEVPFPVDI